MKLLLILFICTNAYAGLTHYDVRLAGMIDVVKPVLYAHPGLVEIDDIIRQKCGGGYKIVKETQDLMTGKNVIFYYSEIGGMYRQYQCKR